MWHTIKIWMSEIKREKENERINPFGQKKKIKIVYIIEKSKKKECW